MIRRFSIVFALVLLGCHRKAEAPRAQAPIAEQVAHESAPRSDARDEAAVPQTQAVPKQPPADSDARPAIDFSSVTAAMAVLTYAMQTKDVPLLLDCFAKDRPWSSVNTVEKPWQRTKLTYDNLVVGLHSGGDYRGFLFGDDGDDSFRNHFTGANRGAWKAVGKLRFESPDSSADQPTYVQWGKQGQRYVVSEIAFPAD